MVSAIDIKVPRIPSVGKIPAATLEKFVFRRSLVNSPKKSSMLPFALTVSLIFTLCLFRYSKREIFISSKLFLNLHEAIYALWLTKNRYIIYIKPVNITLCSSIFKGIYFKKLARMEI